MERKYKEIIDGVEYTIIDVYGDNSYLLVEKCYCKNCGDMMRYSAVIEGLTSCEGGCN